MSTAQKIRMALAYKRMSEAELARALGSSPSALNQRMKTDKFTVAEIKQMAEILGAVYTAIFEFPDGTKI
jgi:transcriptional regulator with XRE-family HTH domain